jgi:hypothetical protein
MASRFERAEARRRKVVEDQGDRAGLRGKINAMCADCIFDPGAKGTWREQVEACTTKTCPLYSVRPTQKRGH